MHENDRTLAARCLVGEAAAFGTLYDAHAGRVFHLLRRLTGREAEAQDLTQETFLAALRGLGGWNGRGSLSTWLCGIACRLYLDAKRRGARHPETALDEDEVAGDAAGDPCLQLVRNESRREMESAIDSLPSAYREVFVLVKVEGLSYQEAAEWLGVPVGTVQSRIWRAVGLLQRALGETKAERARTPEARARGVAGLGIVGSDGKGG
jgi:RNA polymerase sigma-70 factor, ECF subfamily